MEKLSARAILSVKYTAAGPTVKRSVGRFLRYVQYRDNREPDERGDGVEGFLRYAAYRDRTTPRARLFDRDGDADERDRRRLTDYIARSVSSPAAAGRRPARAMYRFVISPEDGRGVDLRQLTLAVMSRLERDAGPEGLPPWIAAEHRNTAHPHVHVVLAARREVAPGRYRALVITKSRLERMKGSLGSEMARQRGRAQELSLRRLVHRHRSTRRPQWSPFFAISRAAVRLRAHLQREEERLIREELKRERERGWER